MIVFDDVEIPWENVFFYRHTKAAAFIRATLHRYSIFPYVQRYLRFADFLLGVAYASARSTGVTMHQAVREKIAQIACYREGINAHLTAAIELAEPSPGGLLMPNQSMMYAGRVFASTQLPAVMHIVRDLCGCQVSLMPSKAMFDSPGAGDWLRKYFTIGEIPAEERRKLFALARDLLNSDYAGHRLTFQLFAQSPPFSHLLAVYNNYDFSGPLDLVARYSEVADEVRKSNEGTRSPSAVTCGSGRSTPPRAIPSSGWTTTCARRWWPATPSTCAARCRRTWTPARACTPATPPPRPSR